MRPSDRGGCTGSKSVLYKKDLLAMRSTRCCKDPKAMSDPTYFSMPSGWAAHFPKSPPLPHAKSSTRSPEVAVSLLALEMSWRVASREGQCSIQGSGRENCRLHDLSEMPSSQHIQESQPIPYGKSNRTKRSCVLQGLEQLCS